MANIFLKVLELSLTGSYIILLVLAARFLLRKSPKWYSYALWGLVFLRLILPTVPESDLSLVPKKLQFSEAFLAEYLSKEEDISSVNPTISQMPPQSLVESAQNYFNAGVTEVVVSSEEVLNGIEKNFDIYMLMDVLGYIWLIGTLLNGGYHVAAYYLFKKKCKAAVKAENNVYGISENHISFILGIVKPAIYISDQLDVASRKVVLCHEQVHLKRKDYLIKPIALAITCMHWFNPLVWLAFYLMNRDCEMSCDEKVVSLLGEECKKVYSYTLLREAVKGQRHRDKGNKTCTVLSFGEDSIKARIKHVLYYKKASVGMISISAVILTALIIALGSNAGELQEGKEGLEQKENLEQLPETAEGALVQWAHSFVDKDALVLYELSVDKAAFESWELVNAKTENGYSFGYSSPWVFNKDRETYKIILESENKEQAEIYYFMENSAPEIYVARELVKIAEQDGQFFIDNQEFVLYDSVSDKKEFMDAYMQQYDRAEAERLMNGDAAWYDWTGNTGYDESYMEAVLSHIRKGTNPQYYDAYKDPVSAAKLLLHLGKGTGMVSNYFGEGEVVNVKYTFEKDGSSIDIPMVRADEDYDVWMLYGGELAGLEEQTQPEKTQDKETP